MRRSVASAGLLVLISASLAPLADGAALAADPGSKANETLWILEHPAQGRPLIVELVRGTVQVVRKRGRIRIHALAEGRSADVVSLAIEETERGLIVQDRYAVPISASWSECLPPTGARGDFWDVDARVHLTIEAPAWVEVSATVMEQKFGH